KLKAADDVVFAGQRRQNQDRRRALLADALADLETVDVGQAKIKHDQVGRIFLEAFQRGKAVRGDLDLQAILLERVDDQSANCLVVLDEKDAWHPGLLRTSVPAYATARVRETQ